MVLTDDRKLVRHSLGLARALMSEWLPVSHAKLMRELKNPDCPRKILVECLGQQLSRAELNGIAEVAPWTRLALETYHGDRQSAAAFLKVPLARQHFLARSATQVGPKELKSYPQNSRV